MKGDLKLGAIIYDTGQKRDAVHVAVAPVVAAEQLRPGQHIGFKGDVVGAVENPIGIVDPFLPVNVELGKRFWMFLYPNTILSIRHEWLHPAFATDESKTETSKAWIAAFADRAGLDYDDIIYGAKDYLRNHEYLIQGGRWEGFSTPPEFWDHYEIVTGEKVPANERGGFFSCSC